MPSETIEDTRLWLLLEYKVKLELCYKETPDRHRKAMICRGFSDSVVVLIRDRPRRDLIRRRSLRPEEQPLPQPSWQRRRPLSLSLLDGLILFLLLSRWPWGGWRRGADLGAELAAHALVIVDDSHAVDHMDGVLLALLLAQAAADAGVAADAHSSLTLIQVGAGHVDLLAHGHGGDQAAGAGLHAGAAVGALLQGPQRRCRWGRWT